MNKSIFITIIALCISGSLAQWDCPATGDDMIGHPLSCYKFIICHNGVGHVMNCALGLKWNAVEQHCDWPELANCELEGPETGDCPSTDNHENPIFFPNTEICSRFFMCCSGNKISMFCGAAYQWNEQENYCDFPENAKCDFDSELNVDVDCPAEGLHWLPHPESCQHFFICNAGDPTLQRCPNDGYWNVITETCDIADNVVCDIECPDTGHAWVPHPKSCHHFFFCFDGVSDLLSCAPGLNWDPVFERCDFEENVECLN